LAESLSFKRNFTIN